MLSEEEFDLTCKQSLLDSSSHSFITSSSLTSSSYSTTFEEKEPPSYKPSILSSLLYCPSVVYPPEEEEEELPVYSCTVYKKGYVYIKQEYDAPHTISSQRRWRKLYLQLWGTLLHIYKSAPRPQYRSDPLFILSLAGADAARALDYLKRPNALRLITAGPQFLIRTSSHIEMISWIEHLQAGINISLDLESRPMPCFVTLPSHEFTRHSIHDIRILEIERAREQRRRNQQEILI